MDTLRIIWTGGSASFEPGTTVHIGRDVDVEVQLQNTNVSRRHAEISFTPSGWVLRDTGSAQGTWRDGRQVQTVDIRGTIQVSLGREGRGEVVTLEASALGAQRPDATEIPGRGGFAGATQIVGAPLPSPTPGAAAASDGTVVVGAAAGSQRPGGALRAEALQGATVVTGDVVNVERAGQSYTFAPGKDVSIGRDLQCDIVSSNPTVSRRHARLSHDGSGWTLRDEGSSSGTSVDGKRITEQRLAGSVAAWLGDEATGERLVIVASGTNPNAGKRRFGSKGIALVAAGTVAALVVAVLLVVTLSGGDDGPSNDELAQATVRLVAGDFTGSGTIVDADQGLILTNAHVAAPDALGTGVRDSLFDYMLDPSAREIDVLVAPALGKAAEPRYIAEVVAVDGYLDLAVLRITKTTIGQLIEPESGDLDGLVEIGIGDSSAVQSGDAVRVFGYPTASQTATVTFSDGKVSGQVKDERVGSNEAMLNITAPISPGNSGGLAVNDAGQLVGVPSLIRDDEIPSMRPSNFAKDLVAAARSGDEYVSPYFRPLTSEKIKNVTFVDGASDAGIRFDCSVTELTSLETGVVGVSFEYEGFEPNEHQDVAVAVWAGDELLGLWTLHYEYPVEWATDSGCATITVPVDVSKFPDSTVPLEYTIGIGPNYVATE
jgi:pSer/pThr/pTyr-binding forkhead associated (FHA) protein